MKPFDLEAAKRGEPICTVQGCERFFLGVNTRADEEYQLVVTDKDGGLYEYAIDGTYCDNCYRHLDLRMAEKPKVKRVGWSWDSKQALDGASNRTEAEAKEQAERYGYVVTRVEWEEEA